jgi:prepilin-type N-terminal cleavage/methylation domain-containing protein
MWAKMRTRKGFSLIELVVTVVIIGIITVFALMAGTSGDSIDAQVEAKKVVRTINMLRSAWLAYYSEKYEMLGAGGYSYASAGDALLRSLDRHSDGSLLHNVPQYGSVDIRVNSSGGVQSYYIGLYIGDTFPTDGSHLQKAVRDVLSGNNFVESYNLVDASGVKYSGQDSVMIRVK